MLNSYNHIISTFNWNTFLDQKDRAAELQSRLSTWSGINMQKEINEVFNKLCPPDQTWRIDQLELDLGTIEMDSLESDLARRLRMQLTEKLTDLIIYADKAGQSNIEITNQYDAPIDKLRSYLLNGVMPWNYKASDGSLNQLLSWQFLHNRQMVIAMLKEVGISHEDVRKRMAWQMSEPNIQKTIEGFEPGNHEQIASFSNELVKVQTKENVVRAGTADFKKNVWLWILNYLLTERGTLFNKHAFLKSSIVQMSGHYNIGYEELLQLLNDAVDEVSKSTTVKADFLLALRALSKENAVAEIRTQFSNVSGLKIDGKTALLLANASKIESFIAGAGRARKYVSKEDVQLINYLLPGGVRLMQQLVKQYIGLLQPILKSWSKQKTSIKLKEIFWRTVLDYAGYKGNVSSFKKTFTAALVFHLPITKAQLETSPSKNKLVPEEQKYFRSASGERISFTKVFLLIEQCLHAGTTTVVENGDTFTLHQMLTACLEYYSSTSEPVQTLKILCEIIAHLVPSEPPKILVHSFCRHFLRIIKTNNHSEETIIDLVHDSFHFIIKKINAGPFTLIAAMQKKGLHLTPSLQQILIKCFPALNIPELDALVSSPSEKLLIVHRKGLMDELVRQLITHQHLPSWFKNDEELDITAVMREISTHYPEKLQHDILAKPTLPFKQDVSNKIREQLIKTKSKMAGKTGTPVRNAGIVLLNSYISMLFERLNLIKDKKFEDANAQEHAAHYLQYVVTGLCQSEETQLALNKVLCGLPLSKPVHDSLEISEENKNLIEGLIKAAINYWPAIGDCSVDGFRGNWLVRDGLLIEQEEKWELVVEKRAYDILINHSPFSFSIIKHAWMNKPLHVTWPY